MSVARVWKSTSCSVSKAVEHNWHGSSSSGVPGHLTALKDNLPGEVCRTLEQHWAQLFRAMDRSGCEAGLTSEFGGHFAHTRHESTWRQISHFTQ